MEDCHGHEHPLEILDTRVQWADLQTHLQKVLMTDSKCRKTSFASKAPGSVGFLSQVVLIDLNWFPPIPKLPKRVVLKVPISKAHEGLPEDVPTPPEKMEPLLKARKIVPYLFEAERAFYEFYRVHEHTETSLPPIPHFYYAARFEGNHEYLVFECLQNTHSFHVWDNFNEKQIDQMLHAIAQTQAFGYLNNSSSQPGLNLRLLDVLYDECFPREMAELLRKMPAYFGQELEPLVEKALASSDGFYDLRVEKRICASLGISQSLVHGDVWSTNILWDADDHDKLRAVLDWQMTRHGCPATDLIRFLNTCMSGAHRRQNWERYLNKFHEYLRVEMRDLPLPYTEAQLVDSYKQMYAMETLLYMPPLNPIVASANLEVAPELAKKRKETVAEKVRCMLEDIIHFAPFAPRNSKNVISE